MQFRLLVLTALVLLGTSVADAQDKAPQYYAPPDANDGPRVVFSDGSSAVVLQGFGGEKPQGCAEGKYWLKGENYIASCIGDSLFELSNKIGTVGVPASWKSLNAVSTPRPGTTDEPGPSNKQDGAGETDGQ